MTDGTFKYTAFISYASIDRAWARTLQRNLEQGLESHGQPGKVFLDRLDLRSGSSGTTQLQDALRQSRRLVIVATPEAVASPWVTAEWESFFDKEPDHIHVVGLVAARLPEFLGRYQRLDFENHDDSKYQAEFRNLLGDVLGLDRRQSVGLPDLEIPPTPLHSNLRADLLEAVAKVCGNRANRRAAADALALDRKSFENMTDPTSTARRLIERASGEEEMCAGAQRLCARLIEEFEDQPELIEGMRLVKQSLDAVLQQRREAREQQKRRLSEEEAPKGPPAEELLDLWFDHVIDTHRRLVDCFDRPGSLSLIEEAWVELQVRPDGLRGGDPSTKGHELVGRKLALAEVIDLDVTSAPWITGRWLLEGSPGSGKTTLLRHYARTLATSRNLSRIPLFVSLARVVGHDEPWLRATTEGFRAVHGPEIVDTLDAAGRQGHLVVLLDGLDEVPPERRSTVTALRSFLQRHWPQCPVVLSTRPLGRGELPEGYPRLDLLPLDVDRQLEFLAKWFEHGHGDPARAQADAEAALACFGEQRGLAELAGVPLYLTLLALLWQRGRRPPERLALLYDDIFEFLLEGRHRPGGVAMPAQDDVRSALQHLAFGLTQDERWTESPKHLEQRLRSRHLDAVRGRLETHGPWRHNLRRFLRDVYERTQILGPHDGLDGDWRFWHRTFREALTAESLRQRFGDDVEALADWAQDLTDEGRPSEGEAEADDGRGEGRWAEPLALLAGRLPEPDALVTRLAEVRPGLALRSMVFTQGLKAGTLLTTLGLTQDLEERAEVFVKIPEQLGDARACLKLVEQLKEGRPGGFDLYWLGWILDQVKTRWPGFAKASQAVRDRLYDHIPPPPADLFETVETRDGTTKLWCTIPAGQFWMGSPETEEERYDWEGPQHEVVIQSPFRLAAVPVTQAQYAVFEPEHRFRFQGEQRPVDSITWYQAMAFCGWLGSHGAWKGARLPTEAEWEYACRAGGTGRFYNGDDTSLQQVAWYRKNSDMQTHEVGQKYPNNWGLYDMHGNVWEWTASPFKSYAEGKRHVDPAVLLAGLAEPDPRVPRMIRGGSFWSGPQNVRSAFRNSRDPWVEFMRRSFRVLLPCAPSEP